MTVQKIFENNLALSDIMVREWVAVSPDDIVKTLLTIIEKHRIHHLLVMEHEKLVGIISDRDVLKTMSPFVETFSEQRRDRNTLYRKAHHIMTRQPITIEESTSISKAINLMIQRNISCLPVLDESAAVVGVITQKSFLKSFVHLDAPAY